MDCVGAVGGNGCQFVGAGDGDLEGEDGVARLFGEEVVVEVEGDFRLVGVDFHFGDGLGPVDVAGAAEVDKWGGVVPCGFVEVEGILAGFAVESDYALLILAVLAALVTAVGREVEEVPNVGGPKPRAFFDEGEHVLVVEGLVAFSIVAFFGVAGLEGGVGVCTIFREADAAVGVLGVIFVKEFVVLLELAEVPAEVEVVAVDIWDFKDGAIDI